MSGRCSMNIEVEVEVALEVEVEAVYLHLLTPLAGHPTAYLTPPPCQNTKKAQNTQKMAKTQ
ncbi:hypothetical protein VAWG006_37950 [Aeromonas enteropelogenes]|nr:hypothetical protein CVS41_01740 [Aeromonas veronii]BEE19542.1 hypothetical protein VAWG006_37950 [Aeromonas enteropelogenes]BEE23705.1 hypothetical protein VAWG007_38000 [Aeromonas enteropelogenes]